MCGSRSQDVVRPRPVVGLAAGQRQRHHQRRPCAPVLVGEVDGDLQRQRIGRAPGVAPAAELSIRGHAAVAEAHVAEAVGEHVRRTRRRFGDGLPAERHRQVDFDPLRTVVVADHAQGVHVRPAAAEVIRQVGDEAHLAAVAGEAQLLTRAGIERVGDRTCRAQPPAQEIAHRAHAFVAVRDFLAAGRGGASRAQAGEGEREAAGQQHGGEDHLDQGEAGGFARGDAARVHGSTPEGSGCTNRNVDTCNCWFASLPQATRSDTASSDGADRSRGWSVPAGCAGSRHGETSSCQR